MQERNLNAAAAVIPETTPMTAPRNDLRRRPLSAVTRYGIVPLLLLALGTRLGMYVERRRAAHAPPAIAPLQAAGAEPAAPAPAPP